MVVRGHTLTQARKGYSSTSAKNKEGHVAAQSGAGKKMSGESGGFSAVTGRGLKKRS